MLESTRRAGHVREYEYLIMHLALACVVRLDSGSQVDKGENLYKVTTWQRCYFRISRHKKMDPACVCVSEVCQQGQRKTKGGCLLFSLEARGSGWFLGCASEPS